MPKETADVIIDYGAIVDEVMQEQKSLSQLAIVRIKDGKVKGSSPNLKVCVLGSGSWRLLGANLCSRRFHRKKSHPF
jgi:hypothetical protein